MIGFLEERRDLLAIADPKWRRCNRDLWFKRLVDLYGGDEEAARNAMQRIESVDGRSGARLDNQKAQADWKNVQYSNTDKIPCEFCGVLCTREDCTLEHLIARQRGGADDEDNWRISCVLCNSGKSDLELGRPIRAWRRSGFVKNIILHGKRGITAAERFDILTRYRFKCSKQDCRNRPLSVFFRTNPTEGGVALLGNLTAFCLDHAKGLEECPILDDRND